MGKRKHVDTAEEPLAKVKKVKLEYVPIVETDTDTGLSNNTDAEDDGLEVYLIRKPKDVPLDFLETIKFPSKIKGKKTIMSYTDEEADEREVVCKFSPLEKQALLVPYLKEGNAKKDLKWTSQVVGSLFISHMADLSDGYPLPPEEDYLNPDLLPHQMPQFPFVIESINKKPELKLDHLKQRIVATKKKSASKNKKRKQASNQ
uniref:HUN domain-containing protein n=1 Tax=Rhabditophanes sp. KR3021 TaxID=114890 RepID=A0AC35TG37_9BILA